VEPNAKGTEGTNGTVAGAQPPNQSTQQTATDRTDGGAASSQGSEERSGGSLPVGWLQRRLRGESMADITGEQEESGDADQESQEGQAATKGGGAGGQAATRKIEAAVKPTAKPEGEGADDEVVSLTRAELKERMEQSHRDRVAAENARNTDLAEQRRQMAQVEALRELSDADTGDPDKLAEVVRDFLASRDTRNAVQERQNEVLTRVKELGDNYDARLLQPVFKLLPEPVQDKLIAECPAHLFGLAQREWILNHTIEELKSQFAKEAEAKARDALRKNPAFRKELLNEARGGLPEPELVQPSANGSSVSRDMNTWLRSELK
jgi:hypothetical protein